MPGRAVRSLSTPGRADEPRWGGRIDGRWWAGARAPGGWSAYQRPLRGSVLPPYWAGSQWQVEDWAGFDLPPPPAAHVWSRYYDDAVLLDQRGTVHDTIGGVDWDRFDSQHADYAYREGGGNDQQLTSTAAPPGAPYPVPAHRQAGQVPIARDTTERAQADVKQGRALLPSSPDSPAAATHSRKKDRRRRASADAPGAAYPRPEHGSYPLAVATREPVPPPTYAPPAPVPIVASSNGATVVTTTATNPSAGYYSNGYYYPAPTIITITVNGQPMVTAPPSDIWEDGVTYSPASGTRVHTVTPRSTRR
ncbi:RcnB family protein [Sphingomonas sp. IC4-52]|nr:RcnB family protein [Sphingomonas sp. IC4-52]